MSGKPDPTAWSQSGSRSRGTFANQGGEEVRCEASPGGAGFVKGAVYCHFPDDRIVRLRANGTFDAVATLPNVVAADGAMAFDTGGLFVRGAIVAATGGSASNGGDATAAQLRPYANTVVVGTELTADFWTIRSTAAGYRAAPLPTSLERTPWNLESAVYVR